MADPQISDTPTPPALSPEEWTAALNGKTRHGGDGAMFADEESVTVNFGRQYDEVIDGRQRHALAALCLYQQPFGFSSEDVKLLEHAANYLQGSLDFQGPEATWDFPQEEIDGKRKIVASYRSLASRISALLSPEAP